MLKKIWHLLLKRMIKSIIFLMSFRILKLSLHRISLINSKTIQDNLQQAHFQIYFHLKLRQLFDQELILKYPKKLTLQRIIETLVLSDLLSKIFRKSNNLNNLLLRISKCSHIMLRLKTFKGELA